MKRTRRAKEIESCHHGKQRRIRENLRVSGVRVHHPLRQKKPEEKKGGGKPTQAGDQVSRKHHGGSPRPKERQKEETDGQDWEKGD